MGIEEGQCSPVAEASVAEGLVGDPAIGGNDSIKFAPNEDEGLKGFTPPKPVSCGLRDEMEGTAVADMLPVGLLESCEKSEREAVLIVCCGTRLLGVGFEDVRTKPEL